MNNMIMCEMTHDTEGEPVKERPLERCLWVDTVREEDEIGPEVFAVVVRKNGSIDTVPVVYLRVAQDSAPYVLLNPEVMQDVLRKRLGNHPVQISPEGFHKGPPMVPGTPIPGPVVPMDAPPRPPKTPEKDEDINSE